MNFNKACVNFWAVWTINKNCWEIWENSENLWRLPGTLVKFHFLKRFKVLENESIFQNSRFFLARKSIFSIINFKNRSYFTRISQIFRKIYRILIFLEDLYKSWEFPGALYYLVEKFIKMSKMAIMRPPQGVRQGKAPGC